MIYQPSDHFFISTDVLSQEVNGETVLLDLASESYFGLDEVGTRVWQLLQSGSTVAEMLRVLLGEYDVGRQQLEADVDGLLNRLEGSALISRAGPAHL